MIDKSRPKGSRRGTLPDFAPVPRARIRHDGWTPDRQRGFIAALADTGSVKAAAHAVNMTPEGAYLLRRHARAAEFRKAWDAALALGVQRLEDVAMDRALNGVEVPVYCYGKVIGTRRVYNDALLMFLLRNRAPKRFAADAQNPPDAATPASLEKLKRQWRAEWEAERQAQYDADEPEMLARLDVKLKRYVARQQAIALAAAGYAPPITPDQPDPDHTPPEPDPHANAALLVRVSHAPSIWPDPENPRESADEAHAREWLGHVDAGRLGYGSEAGAREEGSGQGEEG